MVFKVLLLQLNYVVSFYMDIGIQIQCIQYLYGVSNLCITNEFKKLLQFQYQIMCIELYLWWIFCKYGLYCLDYTYFN